MQVCKYVGLQKYECMLVCTCTSMQVWEYASIQVWNLLLLAQTCFLSLVVVRLVIFFLNLYCHQFERMRVFRKLEKNMKKQNEEKSKKNLIPCDWIAMYIKTILLKL